MGRNNPRIGISRRKQNDDSAVVFPESPRREEHSSQSDFGEDRDAFAGQERDTDGAQTGTQAAIFQSKVGFCKIIVAMFRGLSDNESMQQTNSQTNANQAQSVIRCSVYSSNGYQGPFTATVSHGAPSFSATGGTQENAIQNLIAILKSNGFSGQLRASFGVAFEKYDHREAASLFA